MNILKILRRSYLSIFMASLILFVSCNGNELILENELEQASENLKFNFSFYESNKGNLISLESFKFDNKSSLSRLEINNLILDEINSQLGTSLDYSTSFKQLDSYEAISNYIYENEIMDENEMQILTDFNTNLSTLEISEAITVLEEDVKDANLSSFKTEKFQYLANVVLLIENQNPSFFTDNTQQRSCWFAVAKLALASAALVAACNPATAAATVATACYLATASFIAASATVGIECGDNNNNK